MPSDIPAYDSMAAYVAALGGKPGVVAGASGHRLEDVHPVVPFSMPAFRANYYTVVLIRTGRGRFFIDGVTYDTRPQTVYFTNPGHIKGFAYNEPMSGYILTFSEPFLKEHVHADVFGDLPFLLAETAPPFYADAETFALLAGLAEAIIEEHGRPSSVQEKVIASLLMALLFRIRDAFWREYDPVEEGGRGSAIVEAFKRELEARVRALVGGGATAPPSVSDLAEAQGLHPNYLSTVVKEKTGRTVGDWMAEKLAAEARALLAGSRRSIKEVSYALGFSEATHFSRFFKRETGLTPTAFRRGDAGRGV
jgi:AraC-like DNA-binding protein